MSSRIISFVKFVGLGDFCRRERPHLNMTQSATAFPGGEAQRLVPAGLNACCDPPVAVRDSDNLLFIDQASDHLVGDADTETIPGLVLIADGTGRLVLRGVHPIE